MRNPGATLKRECAVAGRCDGAPRRLEARVMSHTDLTALGLQPDELALLQRHRFDAEAFATLRQELAAGRFSAERNRVTNPVEAPSASDIAPWPTDSAPDIATLAQSGKRLIEQGKVAVAILNGGMATRFGGRVKGVVEVVGGLSFLAIKLQAIARAAGPMPVFLMNSFATDSDTRAHLEKNKYFGLPKERVHIISQNISVRLTPAGEIFRDAAGKASFYAPGHGDMLEALATSAAFQAFAAQHNAHIFMSNVDNLGATVEAKVLGAHLTAGQDLTVEVASREGGDTGGAPVRRRGRVEVLEGFRFPKDFDISTLPVFNTNSFIMRARAVRGDMPLTWFRADKKVGDAPVVQFERLLGEATSFVSSHYLLVPRQGPEGRFMPVKTPDDIEAVRPVVKARFGL